MPSPKPDSRTAPPEKAMLARQMYVDGARISDIMAATGLSRGKSYFWLDGGPRLDGRPQLPPLKRRRNVQGKRSRGTLHADRVALVARLWRTAERQVCEIEERLALTEQEPAQRERDMRSMAVLVKTIRELATFDETEPMQAKDDDDPVPQDIDEFREALARRIEAFIEDQTGEPVPRDPAEDLD